MRNTKTLFPMNKLTVALSLALIGSTGSVAAAEVVTGSVCADDVSTGLNLVVNGDFSDLVGGAAAAEEFLTGFSSGVRYAGDNVYPTDTSIAIQSDFANYQEYLLQEPFPGNPANGVDSSTTWLYSNGNDNPGPFTVWRQTVSGLKPNTTYSFFAYVSNVIRPGSPELFNVEPQVGLYVGDTLLDTTVTVGREAEVDAWTLVPRQFTTGADQTSVDLKITDSAVGISGDDLALSSINLRECGVADIEVGDDTDTDDTDTDDTNIDDTDTDDTNVDDTDTDDTNIDDTDNGGGVAPNPNADPSADPDGDGKINSVDLDDDNDGIDDVIEGDVDSDGDGIIDRIDEDTDNDGIYDQAESNRDFDGDGVPNYRDLDSDNDGISDREETVRDFDGDGAPNYIDLDADNDSLLDEQEGTSDLDGDGAKDYLDRDDADNDGAADPVDLDDDNDGILDTEEGLVDTDGDGVPNSHDLDSDNDGLYDLAESGADYVTLDVDRDGRIDAEFVTGANGIADVVETAVDSAETDYDSDGLVDLVADSDGDGRPDYVDLDSDQDTIFDVIEANGIDANLDGQLGDEAPVEVTDYGVPVGAPLALVDTDEDGLPDFQDVDSDNDGIDDGTEGTGDDNGNGLPNFRDANDNDLDGVPDGIDIDDDNDGILDVVEGDIDSDNDGYINRYDVDSDNDGINDLVESGLTNFTRLDANFDGRIDGAQVGENGLFDSIETVPESGLTDYNLDGIEDSPEDYDRDGIPNFLDLDSDRDGITDARESAGSDPDSDGRYGRGSVFVDRTGRPQANELPNARPTDTDNDGSPDYVDLNSDSDTRTDVLEAGGSGFDQDGDGQVDNTLDLNGNGLTDVFETAPLPIPDSDGDGIANFQDDDEALSSDGTALVPTTGVTGSGGSVSFLSVGLLGLLGGFFGRRQGRQSRQRRDK